MSAQSSGIPMLDQAVRAFERVLPLPAVYVLRAVTHFEWVRAAVLRRIG